MPQNPFLNLAENSALNYGVPPLLLEWQIGAESGWNPNAINSNYNPVNDTYGTPALGIAQFQPATAAQFGINPMDPSQAIPAMAQYDAQLYGQSGSWQQVLQDYGTTGPGASQQTIAAGNAIAANAQNNSWLDNTISLIPSASSALFGYIENNPTSLIPGVGPIISATSSGTKAASSKIKKTFWSDITRVATFATGLISLAAAFYLWKGDDIINVVVNTAEKIAPETAA